MVITSVISGNLMLKVELHSNKGFVISIMVNP